MMVIDEIAVDPEFGQVYEHGWQSWSPSAAYPVSGTGERPRAGAAMQTMCWRPGRPGPDRGFQGEGLLAVEPGDGSVRLYAGDGLTEVPSIRAELVGDRVMVTADGPVDAITRTGNAGTALADWAEGFAARAAAPPPRAAPTVWCTWYHYFGDVAVDDVLENLAEIGARELPVEVIQIDDGWQAEIGGWLERSARFAGLPDLVGRIRDAGRRAGIWVAPFLAADDSELARDHPEWLVAGADAGHNWGRRLRALDVTHPGAEEYLRGAFRALRGLGVDYFKLDFLYAGALAGPRHSGMPPLEAYRHGLALIRDAVGPDPYIVGSGAPILPSAGLVDAMRVSPDVGLAVEPRDGDMSRPSQRAATVTTVARAWQHGRLWVNDPDCLIARPAVEKREDWAKVVERFGGLRASSDRIRDLDAWGLDTTRRLLASPPPPVPFDQS